MGNEGRFIVLGSILSVIGMLVVLAGLVVGSLTAGGSGSASFGGVIVIGPLPLVFGTDSTAVLIAVAGAVLLIALAFAIMYLGAKKRAVANQEA